MYLPVQQLFQQLQSEVYLKHNRTRMMERFGKNSYGF